MIEQCSMGYVRPAPLWLKQVVVLTTEWLPWFQTSWRDSGYALVL